MRRCILLVLLVLVLSPVRAFGTPVQGKFYFPARRPSGALMDSSNATLRVFPCDTDTAGRGVDLTYIGGPSSLWLFIPDSTYTYKFYEIEGTPDSCIQGMDAVALLGNYLYISRETILTSLVVAEDATVGTDLTVTENIYADSIDANYIKGDAVYGPEVDFDGLYDMTGGFYVTTDSLHCDQSAWIKHCLVVGNGAATDSSIVDGIARFNTTYVDSFNINTWADIWTNGSVAADLGMTAGDASTMGKMIWMNGASNWYLYMMPCVMTAVDTLRFPIGSSAYKDTLSTQRYVRTGAHKIAVSDSLNAYKSVIAGTPSVSGAVVLHAADGKTLTQRAPEGMAASRAITAWSFIAVDTFLCKTTRGQALDRRTSKYVAGVVATDIVIGPGCKASSGAFGPGDWYCVTDSVGFSWDAAYDNQVLGFLIVRK